MTKLLWLLLALAIMVPFQNCSLSSSDSGGEPYPGGESAPTFAVPSTVPCADGDYEYAITQVSFNSYVEFRADCMDVNQPIAASPLNWIDPNSFEYNGRIYLRIK